MHFYFNTLLNLKLKINNIILIKKNLVKTKSIQNNLIYLMINMFYIFYAFLASSDCINLTSISSICSTWKLYDFTPNSF